MKANDKSPSQLKKEQHERYDEQALLVSRGELGYIPAPKSKYSKSCSLKIKHKVNFS